ncbi:MAG: hypothetical protein ACRDTM_11730 [Micromonosporaceae bacterium]
MPNPQVSRLRTLGLMFCLLGGTLITFGWMGTARVACVDCQMPYLLSAGAGGLALIVFGVGLLVIAQLRAEGDKLAERLTALVEPPPAPEDVATVPPPMDPEPTEAEAEADAPAPSMDTEQLPAHRAPEEAPTLTGDDYTLPSRP